MHLCPPRLSFILYNPVRKALTDRAKVLDESCIRSDSVVLEVGAGNGFFTEVLAERAKKVYAVELQDEMVRKLTKRVKRFGAKVDVRHCDIAACDMGIELADVCLMYYSFHEVSNQEDAVKNIGRALKAGGIVSVYEPTIEVDKRVMQNTVKMFENTGFEKDIERDGIFTRFVRLIKTGSKH